MEKASPYFDVQPSTGLILGGQDLQLLVRYGPKAMGRHSASVPVKVLSEGGKVIQEVTLHLTGSSLRMGPKPALPGGTTALPTDFVKPKKFLDGEQVWTGAFCVWEGRSTPSQGLLLLNHQSDTSFPAC